MIYVNRNFSVSRIHQFACICLFALVLIFYSSFSFAVINAPPNLESMMNNVEVHIDKNGNVTYKDKSLSKYKRSSTYNDLKKDATYKYTGKYGEKTSVKTTVTDKIKSGKFDKIAKRASSVIVLSMLANSASKANALGQHMSDAIQEGNTEKALESIVGLIDMTNPDLPDSIREQAENEIKKQQLAKLKPIIQNLKQSELPKTYPSDKNKIMIVTYNNKITKILYLGKEAYYINTWGKASFRSMKNIHYFLATENYSHEGVFNTDCPKSYCTVYVANLNKQRFEEFKDLAPKFEKVPDIKDLLLSNDALGKILLDILKNSNNQHANLMNYLHQKELLLNEDLQSKVKKGFAISAPYTDAKTGKAQQTKFTVKEDGTIEVEYIPRPDLVPHTAQAPTRSVLPEPTTGTQTQTETQTGTRDKKDGSTPDAPDICAQNPDTVMCLEAGSDYKEDLEIPEEERNLEFKVKNIFKSNGTCPSPRKLELLGTDYEFTYQPLCDFAEKIRYMIIFLAVFMSMLMCYNALAKE